MNGKKKAKIEKKLLLELGDPSFPLSKGHRRSRSATTALMVAAATKDAMRSKHHAFVLPIPSQLIQEPKLLSLPTTPEGKRTRG